ncbi:unnamed protein product [Lota lota]
MPPQASVVCRLQHLRVRIVCEGRHVTCADQRGPGDGVIGRGVQGGLLTAWRDSVSGRCTGGFLRVIPPSEKDNLVLLNFCSSVYPYCYISDEAQHFVRSLRPWFRLTCHKNIRQKLDQTLTGGDAEDEDGRLWDVLLRILANKDARQAAVLLEMKAETCGAKPIDSTRRVGRHLRDGQDHRRDEDNAPPSIITASSKTLPQSAAQGFGRSSGMGHSVEASDREAGCLPDRQAVCL